MSCGKEFQRRVEAAAIWLMLATLALPGQSAAVESVRIGGTGMGLAAMQQLGDRFAAADAKATIEVLPSLGTSGGVRAVLEGAIDIAVAARPATAVELAKGVTNGACMKTALVFATSHAEPGGIDRRALPAIFADPAPKWPDGSPLKIIMRSPTGSENPYVAERIPGMAEAFQAASRRGGIPVGATDQENARLAQQTAGSLTIMTLMQLRAERLPLRAVRLDGIEPSTASLADESYGLPVSVCLLLPAKPSAGAVRFVAYLRTPAAEAALQELGASAAE